MAATSHNRVGRDLMSIGLDRANPVLTLLRRGEQ